MLFDRDAHDDKSACDMYSVAQAPYTWYLQRNFSVRKRGAFDFTGRELRYPVREPESVHLLTSEKMAVGRRSAQLLSTDKIT